MTLSDDERALVFMLADRAKCDVSTFIRQLIDREARRHAIEVRRKSK